MGGTVKVMAINNKSITLKQSQPVNRDVVVQLLVDMGYERVSMVIEPGTYSVKGFYFRCVSSQSKSAIRCDFFGDEIDRMVSFRIDTQRAIRAINSTKIEPFDAQLVKRFDFDSTVLDSELMANINEGDYVVH